MGDIVQLVVQALALGSVYACLGVGFSLVFASTRVAQFGAGNVAVFGGVLFAAVSPSAGGLVGLLACAAAGAVLGAVIYLAVMQLGERFNASDIALSIGALAVGLLLDAVVGMWTDNFPQVAAPLVSGGFTVAGASVRWYLIYVIAMAALVLGTVYVLVFRTMLGKSMQAVAHKPLVATVTGIDRRTVSVTAWAISTMLMTTAGALLIPISVISRDVALPLAVAGFAAAIVGGLGDFRGAVVGAFVVGLAQTLFARYVSSAYIDTLVFLVLFLVLVVRPSGLFGARGVRLA